jgi:hypothetical protein
MEDGVLVFAKNETQDRQSTIGCKHLSEIFIVLDQGTLGHVIRSQFDFTGIRGIDGQR